MPTFCFPLLCSGNWNQDFVQALYHWAKFLALFKILFWDRLSLSCPGWTQVLNPPASAPWTAGIIMCLFSQRCTLPLGLLSRRKFVSGASGCVFHWQKIIGWPVFPFFFFFLVFIAKNPQSCDCPVGETVSSPSTHGSCVSVLWRCYIGVIRANHINLNLLRILLRLIKFISLCGFFKGKS